MNVYVTLKIEEQNVEMVFEELTQVEVNTMAQHIAGNGNFMPLETESGEKVLAEVVGFRSEVIQ